MSTMLLYQGSDFQTIFLIYLVFDQILITTLANVFLVGQIFTAVNGQTIEEIIQTSGHIDSFDRNQNTAL